MPFFSLTSRHLNPSQLDSTSAREVMMAVRRVAIEEGLIVIASIHQPSLETIAQFSTLLLLAGGEACYNGPVDGLEACMAGFGRPVGKFVSTCSRFGLSELSSTRLTCRPTAVFRSQVNP